MVAKACLAGGKRRDSLRSAGVRERRNDFFTFLADCNDSTIKVLRDFK